MSSVLSSARRATVLAGSLSLIALAARCGGGQPQLAANASPLAAPARPALPPDADTCDAFAYYLFGRSQLREHPMVAAAAFYWMQRLAPASPLGYYSERVAYLMADRALLRRYIEEDQRTLESEKVRTMDSLFVRAITLDPFFPRALDENLLVAYMTSSVQNDLRTQTGPSEYASDAAVETWVRQWIELHADSAMQAWFAYGRGAYRQAANTWAGELRRHPRDTEMRALRSQALYLLGELDSARTELDTALAESRRVDARRMSYTYNSKVLWEYELGRIHERQNDVAGARDAYERALVEDLSFYPAHVRLGFVAAHAGDTATAVTELERAVQIKDDDYGGRLLLGLVLAARRSFEPATEHLRRAAQIEPWAAAPHFTLAAVRAEVGDKEGAAIEYRRFLVLAARTDPNVAVARRRLAGLAPPTP